MWLILRFSFGAMATGLKVFPCVLVCLENRGNGIMECILKPSPCHVGSETSHVYLQEVVLEIVLHNLLYFRSKRVNLIKQHQD